MASVLSRRDFLRQAKGLTLATPFLGLVACDGGAGRRSTVVGGATMGTTYSVQIPRLPARLELVALEGDITRLLETVNAQMSTFRPESELSLFNAGSADMWTPVSADTLAVVETGLRVGELTGGAFDPTVGPLVALWGFGAGAGRRQVPPAGRIDETLDRVGLGHVRTRQAAPALAKDRDDTRVDLSGIAKGFAVDKIAEHLEQLGVEYYLVEIGGELRGRGYNTRGGVWRVGIERPVADRRSVQRVVRLGGQALATSGDYRIFFERGGARYPHVIDPRNGRPVDHGLASATVIAPTTKEADALSTALMVLGAKAGLELARREGIAAFFITKTDTGFAEIASPEFGRYLIA